jgi:hypothetical protein
MKTVGVFLIFMGLIVGAVPLFTDCQAQGNAMTLANGRTVPMKCHWTALAEIALAVPLLAVGGLMAFSRRRETLRALSILGVLVGVFVVLLPTNLIGVCMSADMLCNMVMKPTLVFSGALIMSASLVALMILRKEEPEVAASEGMGRAT